MRHTWTVSFAPFVLGLLLTTGCGRSHSDLGAPTSERSSPTGGASGATSPSAAPSPSEGKTTGIGGVEIAWPRGPYKKYATAALPERAGSWAVGPTLRGDDTFRTYFPPGADRLSQGVITSLEPSGFPPSGYEAAIQGHVYCEKSNDKYTCTAPLDGGVLSLLVGADLPRSVGFSLGNTLYARFR